MGDDDQPAQDGSRKRSVDDQQSGDSTAADPFHASFQASMTFASIDTSNSLGGAGCDCDECGVGINYLPNAIASAVKRYKAEIQSMPLKRTQHRALGKREQQTTQAVAVYEWTLPSNAEPLVEFGNSHRFIWIQRLPDASVLQAIGKGIIGSADEEKQRVALDWKQGDVVFVPSNGGKAVGWVHVHHVVPSSDIEEGTGDDAGTKSGGHVILQIAKVPVGQTVPSGNNVESKGLPWYDKIRHVCRKVLEAHKDSTEPTNTTLDGEDAMLIRESMQ
jgi:hypothetical protein